MDGALSMRVTSHERNGYGGVHTARNEGEHCSNLVQCVHCTKLDL